MFFRRLFGAALLLCLFSGSPMAARASPLGTMPIGATTRQPFGHYALCRRSPAECRTATKEAAPPVLLDVALMQLVSRVNKQINAEIQPALDQDLYGVEERWTLPASGRGDCEDYALLKRERLHAAGIPLSDLLLTVVRKRDGTGHAILTLRTRSGDFVLDNLDARVRPWADVPYRFVKRQSNEDPARWVEIEKGADTMVSAMSR